MRWGKVMPRRITLSAVLLVAMTVRVSGSFFGIEEAVAHTGGSNAFTSSVLAHVITGAACGLIVVCSWWLETGRYMVFRRQ